ncbi:GDNF family receptor alpha-like [Poeciliopsis prolifica]|uniref:GDNF family receptor alpha-like n=1 Tax=Poeciliopsis prolifica TaxID=188132 RepID=UPI0024137448|nr:GDNF family receptor alpha-like [Poeciliopsis prolifica]
MSDLFLISSFSFSSPASGFLASVETCMSDLCSCERALVAGNCEDDRCQIKGSENCNLTIQAALDHFPSLQGCVCTWEEEFCDSIQMLATQCLQKPAIQQGKITPTVWKSSNLADNDVLLPVYEGSGSCVDRIGHCVSEPVCNKRLTPVLQACMADQCDNERCRQEIQQFYGGMPQQSAEMLVMCECDDSDQSCLLMKSGLQSGACGVETRICQERVTQCVQDSNCRYLLKTLQDKCWNHEEILCSERNLQENECFTLKDPALILGTNSECRRAFLATLGTVLHHPCTCKGVHSNHLRMCNMILEVFHNRLHFMKLVKSNISPSKAPEINESEHSHMWPYGYLLYAFSALFLAGVVIISPLVFLSKMWLKRREQIKLNHQRKVIVSGGRCLVEVIMLQNKFPIQSITSWSHSVTCKTIYTFLNFFPHLTSAIF